MDVVDRIQQGDMIQRVRVWDGNGMAVSDRRSEMQPMKKKGATAAPFLAGEAAYRFLPPFFFPPLAVFFAIALIPPFTRGILSRGLSPRCSAAASWHVGLPLSAPVASLLTPA